MPSISTCDKLPITVRELVMDLWDLVKKECPHLKITIDCSLVSTYVICAICGHCIFDDNEYVECQTYLIHVHRRCGQLLPRDLHDKSIDMDFENSHSLDQSSDMTAMMNQPTVMMDQLPDMTVMMDQPPDMIVMMEQPPDMTVMMDQPPDMTVMMDQPPDMTVMMDQLPDMTVMMDQLPDMTVMNQFSDFPSGSTNHASEITGSDESLPGNYKSPLGTYKSSPGSDGSLPGNYKSPLGTYKSSPGSDESLPGNYKSPLGNPSEISSSVKEFNEQFKQAAIKFRESRKLLPILENGSSKDQLSDLVVIYEEIAPKRNQSRTRLYLLAKMGELIAQQSELEEHYLVQDPKRKKTNQSRLRIARLLYELFPTQYELLRHTEQISYSDLQGMNNDEIKQLQQMVAVWSSSI
ncbi:11921_t:CDS:1 [Ambispora leptoticha]|uniref:11921_t:CDS:1 n=1 Tax=Ambispora leptoticha TaxID=144679 RepID=A0A9N8V6M1_9GLOM|nr:11921_t:CDS:1 [Ambispora leptoticha]